LAAIVVDLCDNDEPHPTLPHLQLSTNLDANESVSYPPTPSGGDAACFDYQSTIAAISANIAWIKWPSMVKPMAHGQCHEVCTEATHSLANPSPATAPPLGTTITADVDNPVVNDRNMHPTYTLHPPMGATTVPPPLPPSDIHFGYQSELAALSAAIEQMKQQRPMVPPLPAKPPLPSVSPTIPLPSTATDLLDAEQRLEAFLLDNPQTIDHPDDTIYTPDPQFALSSLTATIALQTKVLRTMTVILGEIIVLIDKFVTTRPCPRRSPKSSCPPNAPTIHSSINSKPQPLPWLPCHPALKTKPVPVKIPRTAKPIPAKPPCICSRKRMEPVRNKDSLRPP